MSLKPSVFQGLRPGRSAPPKPPWWIARVPALVLGAIPVAAASCAPDRSPPPCIPSMGEQYGGDESHRVAPACVRNKHDAVIVLGCPSDADGSTSACQEARVGIALAVAAAGYGDAFIVTGGAVHTPVVEAFALRDLLLARGIPDERIEVEPKAEHTDENLYFSSRIMQSRGWSTALVVSEEPGHLVGSAVCDSNCCVALGRLTLFDFPLPSGARETTKIGHYELYPRASEVSPSECEVVQSKFMCLFLPERRACKANFRLAE